MSNFFKSTLMLSLAISLAALSGCGPRGETRTLTEVLNSAKESFVSASAEVKDEQVKAQISEVGATLDKILGDSSSESLAASAVASNTVALAERLGELVKVAGYPSRPAMGELALQYRTLSADASKGAVNPARVKLLVARTYSLLASELQGTQFAVNRL